MYRKWIACFSIVCLAAVLSASAQPDKPWKSWFGHLGIGFSLPQGDFGDAVDDDWLLVGGATYWPDSWPIGITAELSWNDFDVNGDTIRQINEALEMDGQTGRVDRGSVEIWALTFDAVWSAPTQGSVGFDVMVGPGVYRAESQLSTTGTVIYPPFCEPWWPWRCFPGGVGPGNIVVDSRSTTEIGWNVGAAINFELASGSELYVEVKYNSVDVDLASLEYLPIVVGYRW